jgi:hypothetical protein
MNNLNLQTGPEASIVIVDRESAVLPQTAQTPYFTVTGKVLITQIVGEVTVVFDGTVNSLKLISNPTVGADVDLCTALVVTSDVLGSIYNITGTLANALVVSTSGAIVEQKTSIIVADGTIDLDATASDTTGSTKWTLHYIPLDKGSKVEAV